MCNIMDYKIKYRNIAHSNFNSPFTIINLVPDTTYTIYLYFRDSTAVVQTVNFTTLEEGNTSINLCYTMKKCLQF